MSQPVRSVVVTSTIAGLSVEQPVDRARLAQIAQEIRTDATECRRWSMVPCVRNHASHADQYERWASAIEAAIGAKP